MRRTKERDLWYFVGSCNNELLILHILFKDESVYTFIPHKTGNYIITSMLGKMQQEPKHTYALQDATLLIVVQISTCDMKCNKIIKATTKPHIFVDILVPCVLLRWQCHSLQYSKYQ